jgi:hypothetical protein
MVLSLIFPTADIVAKGSESEKFTKVVIDVSDIMISKPSGDIDVI